MVLWGILATAILFVITLVAIKIVNNYNDKRFTPLAEFLSAYNYDVSQSIECHVIECVSGDVVNEEYCSPDARELLASDEYTGACVRLIIPHEKMRTLEVYAIARAGKLCVFYSRVW